MNGSRNMLPESEQRRFDADLEAELRVCSDRSLDDPALLADRLLRRELAAMAPAPLPARLRHRLMRRLSPRPVWPLALAASALAALVLALTLRSSPPTPTPTPTPDEVQQLGYALAVIGEHTQDGIRRALRHGENALDRPLLEPANLPYLDLIRSALPGPAVPLPNPQEYTR